MRTTDERLVVLLEPTSVDASAAAEHGRVVTLFGSTRERPPVFSGGFCAAVLARLEEAGFDPDRDALVLAGSTVALARSIGAMLHRHGRIRVLAWDARAGGRRYVEMTVGGEAAVSA